MTELYGQDQSLNNPSPSHRPSLKEKQEDADDEDDEDSHPVEDFDDYSQEMIETEGNSLRKVHALYIRRT